MTEAPLAGTTNQTNEEYDRLLPKNTENEHPTLEEEEGDDQTSLVYGGKSYSFPSSQKQQSTAGVGLLTLVKYFISTGILALPYVTNRIGLVPACILILFIGYLNLYTLKLLDQVATQVAPTKTDLGRLCEIVTRKLWIRYFAEINLHIMCVGAVITEIVFISEYLSTMTCSLGWSLFCDRRLMQFALILVLVIPVMTITDLHYLAFPNAIGLFFQVTFCVVFVVASISIVDISGVAGGGIGAALTKFDYTALPVAFATCLYTFEGVGLLMDIRASVGAVTEKTNKVLNWSFLLAALMYVIFGACAVLAFGDNTQEIIFLNLNQHNKFYVIVEFGYIVAIIMGIPTVLFTVTRIIENYKVFRKLIATKDGRKSKVKRQIVRIPLVVLICAIASVIPSFNSFISFLAGINFTLISFVIPVILYYLTFRDAPKGRKFTFTVNWAIMIIGIILGVIATVQSLYEMISGTTSTTTTTA